MTKVVSLYAGPGAGKSTSAAYLFAQLKRQGVVAELVREFAKDYAWEDREIGPYGQFALLGEQIRRETMLLDKVKVIVTDSPVWLCAYYAERYAPEHIAQGIDAAVRAYYNQTEAQGHEHVGLWLDRDKPYVQKGRFETREEALQVDKELQAFLRERDVYFRSIQPTFENLRALSRSLVRSSIG